MPTAQMPTTQNAHDRTNFRFQSLIGDETRSYSLPKPEYNGCRYREALGGCYFILDRVKSQTPILKLLFLIKESFLPSWCKLTGGFVSPGFAFCVGTILYGIASLLERKQF